jgi:hypothetical protein
MSSQSFITLAAMHPLESICCLVLNEYNSLNTWFILKAHNQKVAKEWMKQMSTAQVISKPPV